MSSKNIPWTFHSIDTPEQIEMCLNCKKATCNNCLGLVPCKYDVALKGNLSENERKYHMVLNKTDKEFLKYYPIMKTDRDIGRAIGKAQSTIHNIREKLGLPIARCLSIEERKELVEKWTA